MQQDHFIVDNSYPLSDLEALCEAPDEFSDSDWTLHQTGIGEGIGQDVIILEHEAREEQMLFVLTGVRGSTYIYDFVHHSK